MTKKKKTKKKKLWGLIPYSFPRPIRGYMDQDYFNKLSQEEKEWLSRFNNEYYGNTIGENALHFKKTKTKDKRTKKYKTEKTQIKREIYSKTNQINRDIFNKNARYNYIEYGESDKYSIKANDLEDCLIDLIDLNRNKDE